MVCQIVYPSDGVPLKEMMGLEDFLQKLKLHLMEKVIYTKANNDLIGSKQGYIVRRSVFLLSEDCE